MLILSFEPKKSGRELNINNYKGQKLKKLDYCFRNDTVYELEGYLKILIDFCTQLSYQRNLEVLKVKIKNAMELTNHIYRNQMKIHFTYTLQFLQKNVYKLF
ncbi:hypothetical protein MHBO_000211 [Bonamia ostreae]|uniref:Uncharacterized protein n=1 Tax=Bonamia ostreae TaxID=126728 RepID=A0ABV2AEU5_9EUKA